MNTLNEDQKRDCDYTRQNQQCYQGCMIVHCEQMDQLALHPGITLANIIRQLGKHDAVFYAH